MIEVFFDGVYDKISGLGVGGYGYIIKRNGFLVRSGKGVISNSNHINSSLAEFEALNKALDDLTNHVSVYRGEGIKVYGCSSLVINQCTRRWRIISGISKKYVPMILKLVDDIEYNFSTKINFQWVNRGYNKDAYTLASEEVSIYKLKQGNKVKL